MHATVCNIMRALVRVCVCVWGGGGGVGVKRMKLMCRFKVTLTCNSTLKNEKYLKKKKKSLPLDLTRVQLIYGKAFSLSISPFLCSPTLTFSCTDWLMIRGRCCVHVLDFILAQLPYCSSLSTAMVFTQQQCKRARRAKCACTVSRRLVGISDRSAVRSEIVHAESSQRSQTLRIGSDSFFSLLLECQQSAGVMAHRCRYSGASVFDRRRKFWESAARSGGLAKKSFDDRQTEPENKALCTHLGTC